MIRREVENHAIKLRLKIYARLAKRTLHVEESQIFENGTNSEGSLSMIDSASENQENKSLSESQIQMEEELYKTGNLLYNPLETWNQNSNSSLNTKFRGNATCKNQGASDNLQWKEDVSSKHNRTGSVIFRTKRSSNLNEKNEQEVIKKSSLMYQTRNSIHPFNGYKKEAKIFMMDFDVMKVFSCYFPHNNITSILKEGWHWVGSLGFERSLSHNKNALNYWKRKKPSKRKKPANTANKFFGLRPVRQNEKKAVTFF